MTDAATGSTIQQDALLSLRKAISTDNIPTPTTTTRIPPPEESKTDDLSKATYLYFPDPASPHTIDLSSPTRFVSAASDSAVDVRSIFFAWQKKDVAIPEYIASAQELNDAGGESGKVVQNLVFVERLDLITWLEGATDESEYIKPLVGDAAAAAAAAAPGPAAGIDSGAKVVQHGKAVKVIDPRLQEIYNGERKMGDRNTVLRGIKPTVYICSKNIFHMY